MGNYDLVLLDEPTAGVNPTIVKQALALIRRMVENTGVSVFLIEHDMKVVLDLADICGFLSNGKIMVKGSPRDVLLNDDVRKMYLGV